MHVQGLLSYMFLLSFKFILSYFSLCFGAHLSDEIKYDQFFDNDKSIIYLGSISK